MVLSLFDEIGGVWAALEAAGCDPVVGLSSETSPRALEVLSKRFPKVRSVGPVEALSLHTLASATAQVNTATFLPYGGSLGNQCFDVGGPA